MRRPDRSTFRSKHRGFSLRAAALCLALVLVPSVPAAAAAGTEGTEVEVQDQHRNPVIFVHGYQGSSWNWSSMMADFRGDGYPDEYLYAWDYDTTQSNETTAHEFAEVVDEHLDRTGADQVDVVTHSMGGLSTRWYMKFLDGDETVSTWVSLAGPNNGTYVASWCSLAHQSCRDMQPGSDFLSELNAGDPTPGSADYGTWWSRCDGIIVPARSTVLDGAENHRAWCTGHLSFLTDDSVSEEVREFVR
ncbi:alpha/beta fold hydrolase [Haloechinothrix sp. LS1_15]|uniref:esterase/lipase family protein n=1 Tax=Haloechinothrix sp. LS1_15 TaxID=2652248 RepID=UPI0029482A68|nr:alpha/beta fold hydrolase [Haloechinothrix sp. LS1_15]MDV6012251.1 alpha/beta fold hydrolase [Haloechinothrix sp. LS1_15]